MYLVELCETGAWTSMRSHISRSPCIPNHSHSSKSPCSHSLWRSSSPWCLNPSNSSSPDVTTVPVTATAIAVIVQHNTDHTSSTCNNLLSSQPVYAGLGPIGLFYYSKNFSVSTVLKIFLKITTPDTTESSEQILTNNTYTVPTENLYTAKHFTNILATL